MKAQVFLQLLALSLIVACRSMPPRHRAEPAYWDAHTHLSLYGADALDSLAAHGVSGVRDLGTDLELSLQWKNEIASGQRRGPRIFTAGVILDGPKENATPRWTRQHRARGRVDPRKPDLCRVHNIR